MPWDVMCFREPLRGHNVGVTMFIFGLMAPLMLYLHWLNPPDKYHESYFIRYLVLFIFGSLFIGGAISIVTGIVRYCCWYRDYISPDAPYLTPMDDRGRPLEPLFAIGDAEDADDTESDGVGTLEF